MLFRSLCIISIIFAMCTMNRAETCNIEGEERNINIGLTDDVIQVCFDNGNTLQWTYICNSEWNSFGDPNSEVYCKRFGYIGLGFEAVTSTPNLLSGTEKLTNLDCIGNETSLIDCAFSTTTEACQLVSNVSCEECQNKFDCLTPTKCIKRNANSRFRSCVCLDECMNGGFCFDELCVCPQEYTGNCCETNIPISPAEQPTPQQQITTSVHEITESTTATGKQTININSLTKTNTRTTQSQIPEFSITTFSVQPTHSPTIQSINIKSNTIIPNMSQLATTAIILSTNIPTTNHQTTNSTDRNLITDYPTRNPKCGFGRKCRVTKDRTTIRILFSTASIIVIFLISLIILCLFCCICRLHCKVKKYRNMSVKRQNTEIRSCIITNFMNIDQTSAPTDLEVSPYYSHIPVENDDRESLFESVFGREIVVGQNSIIQSHEIQQEGLWELDNHNNTGSNQETFVNDELALNSLDEINFYHKLVNNQAIATHIFTNENAILNKLIEDRKMGEFDYVEPQFNLSALSNSIVHGSNEIAIKNIRNGDVFATGNFGVVSKAVYTTKYGDFPVAIKTLREEANNDLKIAFIREAAILAQFNHPNILKFVGIVTTVEPNMIVTELLSIELRQFLIQLYNIKENSYQNKRKFHKLQLKFCREIVEGMEHLALKKFIHRDLAARNILIGNDMSCRIADFGMSRNLKSEDYYKSKGGSIPLRWTAPEAVLYKRYSEKSDVWAYGMTLYEIWTLGCKPWQDNTNEEIVWFIEEGEIPLQPSGCPNDVYNVMMHTWRQSSADRPRFSEIKQMICNVNVLPFSTDSVSI